MKNLQFILLLTIILGISLVSCVKDNVDDIDIVDEEIIEVVNTTTNNLLLNLRDGNEEGLDLKCITILYSFDFLMENGTTVSIFSEEDFFQIIQDSMHVIADFVYPLEVLNADDETVFVNNVIELGEMFISCIPDSGWVNNNGHIPAFMMDGSCFEMVFPINLIDMHGNEIVVENLGEFIDMQSMHDQLFFDWPLNLMDEHGEMHTAESADGFFEMMLGCDDFMGMHDSLFNHHDSLYFEVEYLACYELIFPFSVVGQDGEIIVIEDADNLMFQVFGGCNFIEFVYPLYMLNEEGDTITAENEFHLMELMEECDWDGPVGSGDDLLFIFSTGALYEEGCYSINYPVYVNMMHAVYSDEEFAEYMETHHNLNIQYPVTVTLVSDSTEVVLQGLEDLLELIEECE